MYTVNSLYWEFHDCSHILPIIFPLFKPSQDSSYTTIQMWRGIKINIIIFSRIWPIQVCYKYYKQNPSTVSKGFPNVSFFLVDILRIILETFQSASCHCVLSNKKQTVQCISYMTANLTFLWHTLFSLEKLWYTRYSTITFTLVLEEMLAVRACPEAWGSNPTTELPLAG